MSEDNPTQGNPAEAAPEQIDQPNAVEREARLQGWVEQDQYRGDEQDWVDAETFVKRGREVNPILRANNKRLMAQIDEIKRQNQDLRATMEAFSKHHEDTAARAYDQALVSLRKEKKEAIAGGDTVQALELADRIEELKESRPAPKTEVPTPDMPRDPSLTEWAKTNDWFGNDKVKTQIALAYGEELHADYPDLRGEPFLAELEQRLGAEHPARFTSFGNPRRTAAPLTSGRGSPVRGMHNGKGYLDLPADAKIACDKFVKQGLLSREKYVQEYYLEGTE